MDVSAGTVEDLTGTSLEELEREYLSRRIPVLVWITICMEETSEGPSWLTPEGETFTRTNNEHCMVLVGSDSDNYIFNDPYQAGGQISYPRQLAEMRAAMPHVFLLVPGYGAQGGAAADVAAAFDDKGLGAIINSSRGIMCAWKKEGCDPKEYAQAARREAIRMRDDICAHIHL